MKPKLRTIILIINEKEYRKIEPENIEEIVTFTYTKIQLKINGQIETFNKDDYLYLFWVDFYDQIKNIFEV